MKAAIVILILGAVGLGVALLLRHNHAVKTEQDQREQIVTLSNQVEESRTRLDDQERDNMQIKTNLARINQELITYSNNFVQVSRKLEETRTEAKAAQEEAQTEMAKRDQRINQLTAQGEDLTGKINDLNSSLSKLNQQIAETEAKLSASEGDREFLLGELRRLQAEKAELERQFNDLAVLRSQVSKLKDELSIARRLEWIRQGIYGGQTRRGAEILMEGIAAGTTRTNYPLNVELRQDGDATVVSPTNQPPENPDQK